MWLHCIYIFVVFKVTLGTVSNVEEAVEWLSYTYLFVRMKINPQCYGFNYQDVHVSCNFKNIFI
jgi:replicative superfamily II helicase